MALILNIDTATDTASVSITAAGRSIGLLKSENQKEHASFIHAAIASILKQSELTLRQIEAVAVTAGPGSYTGLRVGMATAKGLCYALSKPLITVSTLEAMTIAALEMQSTEDTLFCPMIDARRMEVFTAVFDSNMHHRMAPRAMVLEQGCFSNFLLTNKILFFGNGSSKFKQIEKSINASFADIFYSAEHVGKLAEAGFNNNNFSDVSYSQPMYLKEFYTVAKQKT